MKFVILLINHCDENVNLHRLEVLNETRSGAVQMVKLAEKERDSLEARVFILMGFLFAYFIPEEN